MTMTSVLAIFLGAIGVMWKIIRTDQLSEKEKLKKREDQIDEMQFDLSTAKEGLASLTGRYEGHLEARQDATALFNLAGETLDWMRKKEKERQDTDTA